MKRLIEKLKHLRQFGWEGKRIGVMWYKGGLRFFKCPRKRTVTWRSGYAVLDKNILTTINRVEA